MPVHQGPRPETLADILQATGIDIFDHHRIGVQIFVPITWNLNAPFRSAPPEIKDKLWRETLDLINSRFLADGIDSSRWEPLVKEYWKWLKPGGWLQMAEIHWTFHSQSGQELPNLGRWSKAYFDALGRYMQKNPDIATSRLEWLARWAGFEQVNAQVHDILLPDWRPGTCHPHLATCCCGCWRLIAF